MMCWSMVIVFSGHRSSKSVGVFVLLQILNGIHPLYSSKGKPRYQHSLTKVLNILFVPTETHSGQWVWACLDLAHRLNFISVFPDAANRATTVN